MQFIDLQSQYLKYKNEINKSIQKVLDSSQYILGPQVKELEGVLADFVGVDHCLTTSSGTDSLIMALMALGIGEGDEVITTPFTWVSTAEAIVRVGAIPVFIDIDESTFNMDVDLIEDNITEKTKAILPVSLFGQMPDFDKINEIAKKYDLEVIEDGAQSFGATQNGQFSCGVSKIGITSFFPTKILGCYGDGGAIFTNDDEIALKLKAIRTHGALVRNDHLCIGLNARFDTIQAAVLLAKWPHFQGEVKRRSELGETYTQHLQEFCTVPIVQTNNTHVYAQYSIRTEDRDRLCEQLKEVGIPTAIYYPRCVHLQPSFKQFGYKKGDLIIAEKVANEVLSLPIHPFLTDKEQKIIVKGMKKVLEGELVKMT